MGKRRKPAGELVRVGVVARVLGFDIRTVRKYVRTRVWRGRVVRGRFYLLRSAFEALRDRAERAAVEGLRP